MVSWIKPAFGTYSGNTIFLDGSGNSSIQTMDPALDANLVVLPLPQKGSSSTDVFDYMGVIKTIPLQGKFTGNIGSLAAFVGSMYGLISGAQTGSSYFINEIEGSIICKVDHFGYTWVAGEPNKISWNLKLLESTANS